MAVERIRAYGLVPMRESEPAPAAAPAPPPSATYAPDTFTGWYPPPTAPAYVPPSSDQELLARLQATLGRMEQGNRQTSGSRIPFISQYTPAGREYGYTNGNANCGPASMAMVARSIGYGANVTDAQLINYLGRVGGTTASGTSLNGIAAMAHAMGRTADITRGANVSWIAGQLRAGRLVVANGDYFEMAPHRNVYRTQGHFVLLTGLDAYGRFLVLDPADSRASALTAGELHAFLTEHPGGGNQIAIG